MDQSIQHLKTYYENIIGSLPCYVYWKDRNFVYLGCNDLTAQLLHLASKNDIVGKTDYDFGWEKEFVDSYRAVDEKIINEGKAVLNIEETIYIDDKKIHLLVNKEPLQNEDNEIIGILGISIDITERKQIEEELKIAKEKAEAANQAKSDFISNMEHDLKTPFSGIGGIASYLNDIETDEEKKELLSLMVKSCNQWEQVHHRIFDALEVENSLELKIETVSISNELSEINDMMAATLYMKKLAFEITPISDDLDNIQTDRIKFRLILSSLISNAINFTEQGMIKVITSREGDGYKIQVTDTGIGIPEDKLDYIFERFSKLSRSNRYGADFKGLGLGLYVCREYAKLLGATIQAESKLAEGSTFTVKFAG